MFQGARPVLKDSQGTNILNPETTKIIRNLRGKAVHEDKDREFYINKFLTDNALNIQTEGITKMEAFERYAQKWCIAQGIIGYEYIVNVSFANVRRKKE